ncbi:MAG TPA: lipoprotein [Rhodocyclaceae bacterium]|nr:lipoprotein [Rhodocyclaceae bacterium]
MHNDDTMRIRTLGAALAATLALAGCGIKGPLYLPDPPPAAAAPPSMGDHNKADTTD